MLKLPNILQSLISNTAIAVSGLTLLQSLPAQAFSIGDTIFGRLNHNGDNNYFDPNGPHYPTNLNTNNRFFDMSGYDNASSPTVRFSGSTVFGSSGYGVINTAFLTTTSLTISSTVKPEFNTYGLEAIYRFDDITNNGFAGYKLTLVNSNFPTTPNYAPLSYGVFNETLTISTPILPDPGTYTATFAISPTTLEPVPSKRFTPEQKDALNKGSADLNIFAGATAVGAVGCLVAPDPSVTKACSIGLGLLSGLTWTIGAQVAKLALDPPDLNFTTLEKATLPSLSQLPFTTKDGLTEQSVAAFNLLSNNLLQVNATGTALITSLNRADGALIANDLFWEQQQIQVAQEHTLTLSQLYAQQPQLYANLADALKSNSGFDGITFNSAQFSSFQQGLRINGFSAAQLQLFSELGVDITSLGEIMDNLLSIDPNSFSSLGNGVFSDLLIDPFLTSSSTQLSQTFQKGVIGGSSKSVPEPFTIIGTIIGGAAAFKMRNQIKNK
jgi:hypothetical protein